MPGLKAEDESWINESRGNSRSTQEARVEERQTVVFRMGEESYGIDIFRVHEIIRMREITPIPRTDSYIRGIVNLRGNTIPVVTCPSV